MKKGIICQGILLDTERRILLIKRKFDKKSLPNYWAIPGGNQEEGESNEETAIREVMEEIGLSFRITKLFLEGEGVNSNYFYRFLGTYSGIIKVQDGECDGYGWFTYSETGSLLIHASMVDTIKKLHEQGFIL